MGITAIIVLLLIFIVREISHHLHDTRRDKLISELTDKIKAKDFAEYKDKTQPITTYKPVDNSEEAEWAREQEEKKGMV
jgi:hypothetical protein